MIEYSTYHFAPDGRVSACGRYMTDGDETCGYFQDFQDFITTCDPAFDGDVRCEGCKVNLGCAYDPEIHHLEVLRVASACGTDGPRCDLRFFLAGTPGARCETCFLLLIAAGVGAAGYLLHA